MTQRITAWLTLTQRAWEQRADRLPGSWRQVALACLFGFLPASDILGSAFFPASVRLTATWLAHVHQHCEPVSSSQLSSCCSQLCWDGCEKDVLCSPAGDLDASAERMADHIQARSFQAVASNADAVALCLPTFKDLLARLAARDQAGTPAAMAASLTPFIGAAPAHLTRTGLVPLMASLLKGSHRRAFLSCM